MTNENDLNNYIQFKYVQFLLHNDLAFSKIFENHSFDNSILNPNFAVAIASYLNVFIEEHRFLNPEVKDKAYRIIAYIKQNNNFKDDIKYKINHLFNDTIINLNATIDDDNIDYYLDEIVKRFDFRRNLSLDEYELYKSIVEQSLGNDYVILSYHCDIMKENEFEESVPMFVTDMFYFNSLNAILNEYPEILKNETFRRRVKKIVDENMRCKMNKSHHTQLEKKFIRRNTNYFNKMLKKI